MKTIAVVLLASLTIFLSSCDEWDPTWWVLSGVESESCFLLDDDVGEIPACSEKSYEFGCLHEDDIIELKNILDGAKFKGADRARGILENAITNLHHRRLHN